MIHAYLKEYLAWRRLVGGKVIKKKGDKLTFIEISAYVKYDFKYFLGIKPSNSPNGCMR